MIPWGSRSALWIWDNSGRVPIFPEIVQRIGMGENALGEHVATGVYFYRLETEDFTATRRMVIVK